MAEHALVQISVRAHQDGQDLIAKQVYLYIIYPRQIHSGPRGPRLAIHSWNNTCVCVIIKFIVHAHRVRPLLTPQKPPPLLSPSIPQLSNRTRILHIGMKIDGCKTENACCNIMAAWQVCTLSFQTWKTTYIHNYYSCKSCLKTNSVYMYIKT